MQLTKEHTIKVSEIQKRTLVILKKKYRVNTSSFIREAISEKLEREKDGMFRNYKEIQKYLKELNKCPF